MGFDIEIVCTLHIDQLTGKPFYYSKHATQVFDIQFEIPQEYRHFIRQKGSYFHAYTGYWEQIGQQDVDVESFLEEFPSWVDVEDHLEKTDSLQYWSLKDHNDFKAFLHWLQGQDVYYRISWC